MRHVKIEKGRQAGRSPPPSQEEREAGEEARSGPRQGQGEKPQGGVSNHTVRVHLQKLKREHQIDEHSKARRARNKTMHSNKVCWLSSQSLIFLTFRLSIFSQSPSIAHDYGILKWAGLAASCQIKCPPCASAEACIVYGSITEAALQDKTPSLLCIQMLFR